MDDDKLLTATTKLYLCALCGLCRLLEAEPYSLRELHPHCLPVALQLAPINEPLPQCLLPGKMMARDAKQARGNR